MPGAFANLAAVDDFQQVEVLLRAGMELKYELSEDAEILNGSPVFARALDCLREGLISGVRASSIPGKAQSYVEWYRLSRHPHRWGVIARRVVSHPRWHDMSPAEVRQWVETVASPLSVDDEGLAAIKSAAEAILAHPTAEGPTLT